MKRPTFKTILDFKPSEWPSFDASQEKEAFDCLFSSYNSSFKDSVVVGINNCTDLISELTLLIVCKEDAKPSILVQHIPLLAHLNLVSVVTLPVGSSMEIGNLLANDFGVKRILCFGIKKGHLPDLQDKLSRIFRISEQKEPTQFLPFPIIKQIPIN